MKEGKKVEKSRKGWNKGRKVGTEEISYKRRYERRGRKKVMAHS